MPIDRTTFLVDGFNLYHSAVDARRDLGGATTKWLNIRSLCESSLYLLGKENALQDIYYFSALAVHMIPHDPMTVNRHQRFLECLRSTGVVVELAKFKEKDIYCRTCKQSIKRHEEKETDVAVSVKLIELFHQGSCDTAVIVSGDTDIAPAVRYVKKYFPTKRVGFLFPYRRKNKELQQMSFGFKLSKEQYAKHQFPDPVVLADGTKIAKPATW